MSWTGWRFPTRRSIFWRSRLSRRPRRRLGRRRRCSRWSAGRIRIAIWTARDFDADCRDAVRRHRHVARPQRRVSASRSGEPSRARAARRAAGGHHLRRRDSGNCELPVVAEPEGKVVGTVDEDFAVESLAGDIFLLGTTSWRIKRVEPGPRARGGRARRAAVDSVLARRSAGAHRRSCRDAVCANVREEIARSMRIEPLDVPDSRVRRSMKPARSRPSPTFGPAPRALGALPTQTHGRGRAILRRRRAACSWSFTRRSARASIARGDWRCANASAAPSTSNCRPPPPTTASSSRSASSMRFRWSWCSSF